MRLFRLPRRAIARLGPYPALILVGLPLMVVEPLKLATIFIIGEGHWITGAVAIIVAYAVSLLVLERLFRIVKPKLLSLPWFAVLWTWFVAARRKLTNKIGVRLCRRGELPEAECAGYETPAARDAAPPAASGVSFPVPALRSCAWVMSNTDALCVIARNGSDDAIRQ